VIICFLPALPSLNLGGFAGKGFLVSSKELKNRYLDKPGVMFLVIFFIRKREWQLFYGVNRLPAAHDANGVTG